MSKQAMRDETERLVKEALELSVSHRAFASGLAGIVAAGSNRSTAKEATHELATAEAKRAALIEQIDLRLVSDRDGRQ